VAAVSAAGTAFLAAALLASGCSAVGTKDGGATPTTLTLTLHIADVRAVQQDVDFFAEEVSRRTHGRLRIVEESFQYRSGHPESELRLVRDLRRGRVEMAYVAARAWERDNIRVFRALQAPFLVTGYGLLANIATSPVARRMLRYLGKVGIVGLALVPSELRRPLGRWPLVSADDYRGTRIRVLSSPTSVLVLSTLGARPVTNLGGDEARTALANRRLDAVESSTWAIDSNHYADFAPFLPSNVALFARMDTVVLRRAAFDRLSAEDQAALRAAASATVKHADPAAAERAELRLLCARGLRLVRATGADLESLRRASDPAYAVLEQDPFTKRMIAAIERLKRQGVEDSTALPSCNS
jgi:TRAP-type C4-dicarboxylate transport system substrate-binding protein